MLSVGIEFLLSCILRKDQNLQNQLRSGRPKPTCNNVAFSFPSPNIISKFEIENYRTSIYKIVTPGF
jgi:hypothetical protein